MKVLQTCPVLRIYDEAAARAFYLDYLGFSVEFETRLEPGAPIYLSVQSDGLTLHLSGHHGDGTPGSIVFVRVSGLSAYHAELRAKPYGFLRPDLETRDWGVVMDVIDPFNNRISFCE